MQQGICTGGEPICDQSLYSINDANRLSMGVNDNRDSDGLVARIAAGGRPMTHSLKPGGWLLPILAPLLLAGCASRSGDSALEAQIQQLQMQNQQLRQQLAVEPARVARMPGELTYTVNSNLLFAPGSYQLSPSGQSILARMAKTLPPDQQDKVVVSGYTDNAPIDSGLRRQGVASNQALSQLRADAVMRYMVSQGLNPSLVAAHGFGDTQPVASNATAQGRARNGRIEIAVAQPQMAQPPVAESEAPSSSLPAPSSDGLIWHVGRMPWREGQRY